MFVRAAIKQPTAMGPRLANCAEQRAGIEKPTGIIVGFVVEQKSFVFVSEAFEGIAFLDPRFAFRVT